MRNRRTLLLVLALLMNTVLLAQQQTAQATNEEGWMRSEAKLYVVGAVVLTVLIGLLAYMVRLERKISRLEKR